jgi:hypothetical protein
LGCEGNFKDDDVKRTKQKNKTRIEQVTSRERAIIPTPCTHHAVNRQKATYYSTSACRTYTAKNIFWRFTAWCSTVKYTTRTVLQYEATCGNIVEIGDASMRRPVDRKIGVLAIEQNFASTTERASSQEVLYTYID